MQNVKQTPMKCEVNHYYRLISVPQIHVTNVNTSKIMSTVYPIVSTLFYIVKISVNKISMCMSF